MKEKLALREANYAADLQRGYYYFYCMIAVVGIWLAYTFVLPAVERDFGFTARQLDWLMQLAMPSTPTSSGDDEGVKDRTDL